MSGPTSNRALACARLSLLSILLAGGAQLSAQSFQSQFGEIKYDRTKSPASWHGGVDVEAATGALSINIPLGPGIGDRGLKYVPTLRGQWAPQISTVTQPILQYANSDGYVNDYTTFSYFPQALSEGGFSLLPGYLRLVARDYSQVGTNVASTRAAADMEVPLPPENFLSNYVLPDGKRGDINFRFKALDEPDTHLTSDQVAALIQGFGFDSSWTIAGGFFPTAGNAQQLIHYGMDGELAIGLNQPAIAPGHLIQPVDKASFPDVNAPGAVVLIKGDIAYEYLYEESQTIETVVQDDGAGRKPLPLKSRTNLRYMGYVLHSMRNRVGDEIRFEGTTAKWFVAGQETGVSVACTSTGVTYTGATGVQPQFSIHDLGENDLKNFSIYKGLSEYIGSTGVFEDHKVDQIKDLNSGETISITYGQVGEIPAIPEISVTANPNIPSAVHAPTSISFPGRTISLGWDSPQRYLRTGVGFMQIDNTKVAGYGIAYSAGWKILPAWFSGVNLIQEQDWNAAPIFVPDDSTSDAIPRPHPLLRKTTHIRTLPQPDMAHSGDWLSTNFFTITSHPDGSSTLTRYASPFNGLAALTFDDTAAQMVPSLDQMKALAFLKHAVVETREFGFGTSASQDISADGSLVSMNQSKAHRITMNDRWDLRSETNPDGYINRGAVPFPTRVRVWDQLEGTLHTTEYTNWDHLNRGWQSIHKLVDAAPTVPSLVHEPLSRILTNQDVEQLPDVPALGTYEFEKRGLDSDPVHWIYSRTVFDQTTIKVDNTPNRVGALPFALPATERTFDTYGLNRPETVKVGGDSLNLKVTFKYKGTSGLAAAQVDTAEMNGVGHTTNGRVGATYGYDPTYGRMNSITPFGMSWSLGQVQDGLGFVTSQTDANGLQTNFTWNGSSQLTAIKPPAPEFASTMTPDSDLLGETLKRGNTLAQVRYNAFGELILERRSNDGATFTSSKLTGHDRSGRSPWETVWTPGEGDESQWTALSIPAPGSTTKFDGFGRPISHLDANGVLTQTSYGQGTKTVTVGQGEEASTTTFFLDAKGRLIKIVDALQQVTTYHYDPAGRIAEVHQVGDNGVLQVRKWGYDDLGRMNSLIQPESGTTTYESFNLQGKPTVTRYMGDGSTPARKLTTTYDSLSRVTLVQDENNITLHQLVYGENEAGHGLANGKLVRATTGAGIVRVMDYAGLNGRLSGQSLTIPGLATPLTWSLTYAADGQIETRTYPDGKNQLVKYDSFKALPNGVDWAGSPLTTLQYNTTHWGLENITWSGNNAFTTFGYDADQARLAVMAHTIPGAAATTRAWNYKYDSQGRLTTDGEDTYAYDPLGRLSQAFVRDFAPGGKTTLGSTVGLRQSYSYDPFGNRKGLESLSVSGWTWGTTASLALPTTAPNLGESRRLLTYSMSAAQLNQMAATNHLPASLGGAPTGASYDGQGNLVTVKTGPTDPASSLSMTYDTLGRVVTLKDSTGNIDEKYYYDDQGLRCLTEFYSAGELKSKKIHVYNEARQLIAEYELGLE